MSIKRSAVGQPTRDLTSGKLVSQIAQLALPSMAELALMSVTGLVQAYWLGRLGSMALAATAVATTLRIVLISPMMGLSGGGMAVVARSIGGRQVRQADHAVMQTILLIFMFTVPLVILGQLAGPTFLRWMGLQGPLLDEAVGFFRIIFAGLLFMEMLPSLNGVIRGAGHPEYTLRINIVSTIVLVASLSVTVFGWGPIPALGVRGAAWSSVLSSAAGVAAQLYTLWRGWAGVRLHRQDLRPDFPMMARILRIALPTAAQRFSPNMASALVVRLVTSFGQEVLASYSLAVRVTEFLQFPAFGIGMATSTMVGQNLGAGKPDRAERAGKFSAMAATGFSFLLIGTLNLFAEPILRFFSSDPNVLARAPQILRYNLLAGTAVACAQVMSGALVGAGDALSTMIIHMGSLWLAQLPLCWLLSRGLGIGPQGIWLGLGLGHTITATLMSARFLRGRWKTVMV